MDGVLWHFLQTTDSAFPVGGFGHSGGLEGMVDFGEIDTPDALASFLHETWIPLLTRTDLPLLRLARETCFQDERLFEVDSLGTASRATAEARKAHRQMGRQRLTLLAELTRNPRLCELAEHAHHDHWTANWPVVWGCESACLNLPLESVQLAYAFQSIMGLLTASMKLIRIGPSRVQQILHRCRSNVVDAVAASADITEDEIGAFTPLLDITGARHETASTRLFIS